MDASLANDINRRDARLIAERFDRNDVEWGNEESWAERSWADAIMGEKIEDAPDRAWYVGAMAAVTSGLYFDGSPADCDWDNLYSHLRAEILARRAPQTPPVHAASAGRDGVGSR